MEKKRREGVREERRKKEGQREERGKEEKERNRYEGREGEKVKNKNKKMPWDKKSDLLLPAVKSQPASSKGLQKNCKRVPFVITSKFKNTNKKAEERMLFGFHDRSRLSGFPFPAVHSRP